MLLSLSIMQSGDTCVTSSTAVRACPRAQVQAQPLGACEFAADFQQAQAHAGQAEVWPSALHVHCKCRCPKPQQLGQLHAPLLLCTYTCRVPTISPAISPAISPTISPTISPAISPTLSPAPGGLLRSSKSRCTLVKQEVCCAEPISWSPGVAGMCITIWNQCMHVPEATVLSQTGK